MVGSMGTEENRKKYLIVADSAIDLILLPTKRQYSRLCSIVAKEELDFGLDPNLEDRKARAILRNNRGVRINKIPGGPVLNIAQYLRAKGQEVAAISVVGNNPESKRFLEILKDLSVDIRGIHKREGSMPKCLYVYYNPEHQLPPIWRGNVSERAYIPKSDFLPEFFNAQDVLVFSVTHPEVAVKTLQYFKKNIAYNPGPVFDYLSFEETHFRDIIERTHILSVNKKEALQIQEGLSLKQLPDLFNLDNPNLEFIIHTKGEEGAEILGRNNKSVCMRLDPKIPLKMVDDIGAGDAFYAVAVDDLLSGLDPYEVLVNSTRAAQDSLQYRGAYNRGLEMPENTGFAMGRKVSNGH